EVQLDEIPEQQDEQEQEDDQVQVEQREDQEVRRERDLRSADPHLEHRGDHQQHQDAADDQQVALPAVLLVAARERPCERHYWLRVTVSRLDCTHGVSSASPVNRANQELTPPCDTSDRTRT